MFRAGAGRVDLMDRSDEPQPLNVEVRFEGRSAEVQEEEKEMEMRGMPESVTMFVMRTDEIEIEGCLEQGVDLDGPGC